MGVSYNIYIGPFIKVRNDVGPRTIVYNGCPTKTCSKNGKETHSPFCPYCGAKIITQTKTINKPLEVNIVELTEDRISEVSGDRLPENLENHLIFIPNRRDIGKNFCDDAIVESIDPLRQVEETTEFIGQFSPDIEKIQSLFSEENIKVCWGMIGYYS